MKNPEELQKIISGQVDKKIRLSDEFTDPEQKLEALIERAQQYRDHYETQLKDAQELRDSLVTVEGKLKPDQAALVENMASLSTFYNKMKAPAAAEILQAGTLGDTTVAMLMQRLQPGLSTKIFANMEPTKAAEITKVMQEISPQESGQ